MERKFITASGQRLTGTPRTEFHTSKQFVSFAAFSAAVVFPVVVAPGITRAAPIVYNESSGGDLPEFVSPLPIFILDSGTNIVSGVEGVVFSADFDSFAFKIPAGLKMIDGSLVLSDLTGDVTSLGWRLGQGSADNSGGNAIAFPGGVCPGTSVLPALDADTYNLTSSGIGGSLARSASYTFTFVVAPVPEPTTLCLLAVPTLLLRRPVESRRRT